MKKTFITLAVAAKALALAAGVVLYAGSATADDTEDCPMICMPPACSPLPDCLEES